MGKALNAIGNTAAVVPRTAGSIVLAGIDTLKTGANVGTDVARIVRSTGDKLWEVLSSARNKGKRYNKLYQVPASIGIGVGVLAEGSVRAVVEPTRNAFLNVRDTSGNFFLNIGNTIKRTFDTTRPVSDFRYEKIQMRKPTGDNRISRWAWRNKPATNSASTPSSPAATPSSPNTAPNTNNQLTNLQNQLATLTNQLTQMQTTLTNLQTENQQLRTQLQQLQNQPQQANTRNTQNGGNQTAQTNPNNAQNGGNTTPQVHSRNPRPGGNTRQQP